MKPLLNVTLCAAVLMLGCGGPEKPANRPATTKVSGTVLLKGSPVAGATVSLNPVAPDGKGASGITDELGKYALTTFEVGDGAIPGNYQVSIRKLEYSAPASTAAPGEPGYDPNPKEEPPKSVLPEKYSDFAKSGLTATIGSDPVTALDFNLE